MKKILVLLVTVLVSVATMGQGYLLIYDYQSKSTPFGHKIKKGDHVLLRDSSRVYRIEKDYSDLRTMGNVFSDGNYTLGMGDYWAWKNGVLYPTNTTDRVVAKNGFYHYAGDGDINASGSVTNADIVLISKYINGTGTLTDLQKARSDVDNDGKITRGDLVYLWFKATLGWTNMDTARHYTGTTLFQVAPGVPQLSSKKLFIQYNTISSPNWSFDVEIGGNARIPQDDTLFFGGASSSKDDDTLTYIFRKRTRLMEVGPSLNVPDTITTKYFSQSDSLSQWAGMKKYQKETTYVDDSTVMFVPSSWGSGDITALKTDGSVERISFSFKADGTVTKDASSTTNTASTNSDGNLCVYDGGSAIIIKNALGSGARLLIDINYSTYTFP